MQENMVQSVSVDLYSVILSLKREAIAVGSLHWYIAPKIYNILLFYFQRLSAVIITH